MFGPAGESSFTKAVNDLISMIYPAKPHDSLFDQATKYFETTPAELDKLEELARRQHTLSTQLAEAGRREKKELNESLARIEKQHKTLEKALREQRIARRQRVVEVCEKIIKLSEGVDWDETSSDSAKILGTILLLSPGEGKRLQMLHQRMKPLYKAILSVRLLDSLLRKKNITNKYILDRYNEGKRFAEKKGELTPFQREVVMPLIISAMFQDIGMMHPEARQILKGESGKLDEFRLLEGEDRLNLLKLNHQWTLDYMTNGLGPEQYVGNSREEKAEFDAAAQQTLVFIRTLINDAVKPKQGLGNLIKAPQIYTSVILSTKKGYDIRELPKAAVLLLQIAKKGVVSEAAANSLVSIVGYFPQGYGVAFIPKDDRGEELERYEYGIVNRLYPEDPRIPGARIVTRNQTFISFGNNVKVVEDNNLYFPNSQAKLKRVSESRLREILTKLYHDFEQRGASDLIPKCWEPYDYFSFKQNQNLWNKKVSKSL